STRWWPTGRGPAMRRPGRTVQQATSRSCFVSFCFLRPDRRVGARSGRGEAPRRVKDTAWRAAPLVCTPRRGPRLRWRALRRWAQVTSENGSGARAARRVDKWCVVTSLVKVVLVACKMWRGEARALRPWRAGALRLLLRCGVEERVLAPRALRGE